MSGWKRPAATTSDLTAERRRQLISNISFMRLGKLMEIRDGCARDFHFARSRQTTSGRCMVVERPGK